MARTSHFGLPVLVPQMHIFVNIFKINWRITEKLVSPPTHPSTHTSPTHTELGVLLYYFFSDTPVQRHAWVNQGYNTDFQCECV